MPALTRRWIQLHSGSGTAGPAGPPGVSGGASTPAPNVTASASVVFTEIDVRQQFGFAGVITLPTTDPAYSHLTRIDVMGRDASGNLTLATSLTTWTGTAVAYSGIVADQPKADQTWDVLFIAYNEEGAPTALPFTVTGLTVHAAGIQTLLASEVVGGRYEDVLQGLHTVIQFTVTMANGQYPQMVTFWNDFDDGRGFLWQGWFNITAAAQVVRIGDEVSKSGQHIAGPIIVPAPGQGSWVVKALPGAVADGSSLAGAVTTSYTVTEVGVCLATDITAAAFNPDPFDGDQLIYTLYDPGGYRWDYYQLQFTQPTLLTDPNYWFTFITIQKGHKVNGGGTISGGGTVLTKTSGATPFDGLMTGSDIHINGVLTTILTVISGTQVLLNGAFGSGTGIPYEVWVQADDIDGVDESLFALYKGRWITDSGQFQGTVSVPGTTVFFNGPQIYSQLPPVNNPDGTPNIDVVQRFRLYCASHANDNVLGGNVPYVLQTTAWAANPDGSRDHTELFPQPQPPALDLKQVAPHSLSVGLGGGSGAPVFVKLTGPLFADISNNINIKIASDFVVSGSPPTLTQAAVDLAKSVNFDTTQFVGGSGTHLAIAALAVNKLIAGDALFAGQATFAYSGGGKVTINSSGLTMADNNTSPTSTITITSGGISLVKGSASCVVNAGGVQLLDGSGASCTVASGNVTMIKGVNSVTVASTGVTVASGSSTLSLSSTTLALFAGANFFALTATQAQIGQGANTLTLTASTITLTNSSSSLTLSSSLITLQSTGLSKLTLDSSGNAVFTNPSNLTTNINGNTIITNTISVIGSLVVGIGVGAPLAVNAATSTSATGGSGTLPANPAGFRQENINGTIYKIPFYNV